MGLFNFCHENLYTHEWILVALYCMCLISQSYYFLWFLISPKHKRHFMPNFWKAVKKTSFNFYALRFIQGVRHAVAELAARFVGMGQLLARLFPQLLLDLL